MARKDARLMQDETDRVESRPENAWGHYMLGLAAWRSGDLTGAERAFAFA